VVRRDAAAGEIGLVQGPEEVGVEPPAARKWRAALDVHGAGRDGIPPGSALQQDNPGTGLGDARCRDRATEAAADDDYLDFWSWHVSRPVYL